MDINSNIATTPMPRPGYGFAAPTGGLARGAWTTVDLADDCRMTAVAPQTEVLRSRTAVATKGHVAFVASIPGLPAWSPPLC